jgi:hypothetical protein
MPNCLLNCGKMRSKPLRPEVQLGPALTPRVRVNQEPPFVPFKRQLSSERVQRPPPCRIRNVRPTIFDVISHAAVHLVALRPACDCRHSFAEVTGTPVVVRPRSVKVRFRAWQPAARSARVQVVRKERLEVFRCRLFPRQPDQWPHAF